MKITGFTFIRNAILYDYPIVEAIRSILPICEHVVVAVGHSEDETLELIQGIGDPKIKIVETVWDDDLREGGKVLAAETNKAFDAISADSDWCVYVQGDEVFHEDGLENLKLAMQENLGDKNVDGLLLKYRHFYGSYDYVGNSRRWYRREVRVIRNDKRIRSYKDAQGFRKEAKKLRVKLVEAYVHHYGWVRHPEAQQSKVRNFNRYWHSDAVVEARYPVYDVFDYSQIDSLERYTGEHPAVIRERIKRMNWQFSFDASKHRVGLKERVSRWVERVSGIRIGEYRNYELIDNSAKQNYCH